MDLKPTIAGLKRGLALAWSTKRIYQRLRAHLDRQPVGYPSTGSGVELRLLAELFTPQEAELALCFDWRLRTAEELHARTRAQGRPESEAELADLLGAMERKGCLFVERDGERTRYALHPFVIGMFEARLKSMTAGYYLDAREYMLKSFAYEYLSSDVPQMRVIPIERSIDATQRVSTYDEIRALVDRVPGPIEIAECICRKSKALVDHPCQVTDRKETCMGFRTFADMWIRHGWGREISKTEALEILAQNEKDGLMLLSATMQEPQFVCSCCGCCCGVTEMMGLMPRPVDFAASNYQARVDPAQCNGCQKCVRRCHLSAVRFDARARRVERIDRARCIGCGLCVPTCKQGAIRLEKKPEEFVPPLDHEALYAHLERHKPGRVGKTLKLAKAMLGRKV